MFTIRASKQGSATSPREVLCNGSRIACSTAKLLVIASMLWIHGRLRSCLHGFVPLDNGLLKERFEALGLTQQLDKVRQACFQHANISLLQEFGADLSTPRLSEQILRAMPSPHTLERQNVRVSHAPASTRSKSLEPHTEKGRVLTPPVPPVPPTLSPTIAWKGLLPAHNLAEFPKNI